MNSKELDNSLHFETSISIYHYLSNIFDLVRGWVLSDWKVSDFLYMIMDNLIDECFSIYNSFRFNIILYYLIFLVIYYDLLIHDWDLYIEKHITENSLYENINSHSNSHARDWKAIHLLFIPVIWIPTTLNKCFGCKH